MKKKITQPRETAKQKETWNHTAAGQRKEEREQFNKTVQMKGYDILDTVTGKHTSRTREDIRIKKRSKVGAKIYKEYMKFLNKLNTEANNRSPAEKFQQTLFDEE